MTAGTESGPLLGVDYGLKRVGLAVTDPERRAAVGAGVIPNSGARALARRVLAIAGEKGAVAVVIGLPDGGGYDVDRVRDGVRKLSEALRQGGLQVHTFNEDYTTAAVESDRRRAGGKAPSDRGWRDEAAAVLMLNGFLDQISDNSPSLGGGT